MDMLRNLQTKSRAGGGDSHGRARRTSPVGAFLLVFLLLWGLATPAALAQESEPNDEYSLVDSTEWIRIDSTILVGGDVWNDPGAGSSYDSVDRWFIQWTGSATYYLYHNYTGYGGGYTEAPVEVEVIPGNNIYNTPSGTIPLESANPQVLYAPSGPGAQLFGLVMRDNPEPSSGLYSAYYFKTYLSRSRCGDAPNAGVTATVTARDATTLDLSMVAPSGGADGYMVKVNTTNSFTTPEGGFATHTQGSTAYAGSGEQAVYTGSANNITLTGLTDGVTYYVAVYAYNACGNGDYYGVQSAGYTLTSCGPPSGIITGINFLGATAEYIEIADFTPATGGADGYVMLMNDVNSFNTPANGASLPGTSTVFGGSEQAIYAGASTTANLTVTGLTANTTYYFAVYAYRLCEGIYYFEPTGYVTSISNDKPLATFSNWSDLSAQVGDILTLSATSNSSSPVEYSLVGDANGTAFYNGTSNRIQVGYAGTVMLRASVAADGTYNATTQDITLTVNKFTPTLAIGQEVVLYQGRGSVDLTSLVATNSSGTLSFALTGATGGNSLSGAHNEVLALGDIGQYNLQINLAASDTFYAASLDTVFRVINQYGVYGVLHGFTTQSIFHRDTTGYVHTLRTAADNATGELLLVNDRIYGITQTGGANGMGSVYRMYPDGSNFEVLYSFTSSTADGATPAGGLTQVGGELWGVTFYGGTNGVGTIYSLDTAGGNFATHHHFTASTDGNGPQGVLALGNGKLWGIASAGGTNNKGTLFSIQLDGSNFAVVHTFVRKVNCW